MPWLVIGIAAVGAIAAYDNWKSIRPMLGKAPAAIVRDIAEAKPLVARETPKRVAVAAPAVKPKQAGDPVPPAAIPSAPVPTAKIVPASISPSAPSASQTAKAAFGYCGQGEHINCVGDAGTFWYKGEKIVIADMVSPDVDRARCEVTVKRRQLELTATELKLLITLMERRGRVQSRDALLNDVWGYESVIDTRTVDTHIRRLREKLGPAADYIETIRGFGYRMVEPVAS